MRRNIPVLSCERNSGTSVLSCYSCQLHTYVGICIFTTKRIACTFLFVTVSRALQKSLKRLEQRKHKNLKKIKSEDTDAEMSDDEIDLMSSMIENRLEEDNFLYKCERNESSGLQSIESTETPTTDLNKSDITRAEMNSSRGNAMDCISMDHSIFSPLSIADSDYSSNGIKSVESLNSEKVQSADSICETNILPVEVDMKPGLETNTVLAEGDAKPSCETDILGSELNAELRCKTNVLPLESDLKPSCEIDVLPAEEDPKPSCEADFSPSQFDAEPMFKIHILLTENDVKSSCKTSVSPEKDDKPSCETNIPPELNAKSSCETNILLTESHDKPNCETNLLSVALNAEPNCESNILPAERDTCDPVQETIANRTEASVDVIQSDDLVTDPIEILECDPFIDPEIVNSVADLILKEMMNISHSNAIVESFREFCKNDIHLDSDQNTSVRVQNTDESLKSESTSSNLATQLVSHDVGHEFVKRKIDLSSQNSLKKIRLDENVSNSSAGNTALAFVLDENTNADKIHPLEDETNRNSLKVEDDNTENIFRASILENNIIEIDPKVEHQKISIPNNAINQDACESSDVLLPHPETQSGKFFPL